jgi:hypothetical protein
LSEYLTGGPATAPARLAAFTQAACDAASTFAQESGVAEKAGAAIASVMPNPDADARFDIDKVLIAGFSIERGVVTPNSI